MSGRDSMRWMVSFAAGAVLSLLAGCGGDSGTGASTALAGTAITSSDGAIAGATVTLTSYGNAASAATTGTEQGTATTNAQGAYSFSSVKSGWYTVSIRWTVGRTTRNHQPLEGHAGFLVAHYSDRTALAISDTFKFPGTIPAFVYGN